MIKWVLLDSNNVVVSMFGFEPFGMLGVMDVSGYPNAELIQPGWAYDPLSDTFSEADLSPIDLAIRKSSRESYINGSCISANQGSFSFENFGTITLSSEVLSYLRDEMLAQIPAYVATGDTNTQLSTTFVAPMDIVTHTIISIETVGQLQELLALVKEIHDANFKKARDLKLQLWSPTITKQSQIDAIVW